MIAAAAASLSIASAKHAIRVDAKLDHANAVWVEHCKRLAPNRVRCHLIEEVREEPASESGVETITALEGPVTVTREVSGVLRIHRDG